MREDGWNKISYVYKGWNHTWLSGLPVPSILIVIFYYTFAWIKTVLQKENSYSSKGRLTTAFWIPLLQNDVANWKRSILKICGQIFLEYLFSKDLIIMKKKALDLPYMYTPISLVVKLRHVPEWLECLKNVDNRLVVFSEQTQIKSLSWTKVFTDLRSSLTHNMHTHKHRSIPKLMS